MDRLLLRIILGTVVAAMTSGVLSPAVMTAAEDDEETASVVMRGRQFVPDRTVLHRGRQSRLLFHNQDSELHTFAPFELFHGASVNVSGNGAPEFGPTGLTRVIIPPEGRAEIRFTPRTPGQFRYICDMPGHQMQAIILVE